MATSVQPKGKRSVKVTLGFQSGSDAFNAAGVPTAGATTFEVSRWPGDISFDVPGATDVDPLDRGEFMSDAAPVLADDQNSSGAFTAYYTHQTDPAALGLLDILNETGLAAALANVVANGEVLYCDMKVEYIHPSNPADAHGKVFRQCRLTYSGSTDNPVSITVNWKSRDVRPSIVF